MSSAVGGGGANQVGCGHANCVRQLGECPESQVDLGSFDLLEVPCRNPDSGRQLLLREPLPRPLTANRHSQGSGDRGVLSFGGVGGHASI